MARTKLQAHVTRVTEEIEDEGPVAEVTTEAEAYAARWEPLIQAMQVGVELHGELREVIEAHRSEQRTGELPAVDPLERIAQIKAKVEALSARYSGVLGKFLVWREQLRERLHRVQAHLGGIPVLSAVDEASAAFDRAFKQLAKVPQAQTVDPDSIASLEARVRYLTDVREMVARGERFPAEIGRAIQALNETMARHAHQLDEAKFKGSKDNTSAYRWTPPRHPLVGPPVVAPRPVLQPDAYAFLTN